MTTCKMKFTRGGSRIFIVDDVEVDEWTYRKGVEKEAAEQRRALKRQNGKRFKMPGLFGDRTEWRFENGGKGRHAPQLGKKGDPRAYFNSRRELVERAKQRGYVVDHSD